MKKRYDQKLKSAMDQAFARAHAEARFKNDPKLADAVARAHKVFKAKKDVLAQGETDVPVNVTRRAMRRVRILMAKRGERLGDFTFDGLLQWIYDNMETIIKVIFSLLMLVLI